MEDKILKAKIIDICKKLTKPILNTKPLGKQKYCVHVFKNRAMYFALCGINYEKPRSYIHGMRSYISYAPVSDRFSGDTEIKALENLLYNLKYKDF